MTYAPVALRSVMLWFVLVGLGHSVFAASPSQTTYQSLFNGEDLSGWEGDTKYWRVENHAIVGEIPQGTRLDHNTWLVWRGGTVSDFELVADVKLTGAPSANSGIQFRCQAKSVRHVAGYQADLDQGRTWLGRIYDEHGRGLLVERGTRVAISADGKRRIETFAPASAYYVLFRPGQWNRYRIVAVGPHVQIYVNGTLFSELFDEERGEADREGTLALQLHAGPHTRVEFRRLMLRTGSSKRLEIEPFRFRKSEKSALTPKVTGRWPRDEEGRTLNLGFESGTLQDWTATGDAFVGQPVDRDGISKRWPGQTSGKAGKYFVGGYELSRDRPQGTLTSRWFPVDHPFASFLIGGGAGPETRVELLIREDDGTPRVWFTARGRNREAMERVVVDLRPVQGRSMAVRLVDESSGGWGHLNFDDFRFHQSRPDFPKARGAERTTFNPVLQHLRPLRKEPAEAPVGSVGHVLASMYVEPGFAVDLVAAEPQVHQPIAITFDARGRLWVAEAHSYPQKRPPGEGRDQIIILEDADGDGRFEKRKIFAKGLNLVSGLEVGYGGVWVGAAPELLFIPDADGDDRPDGPPRVLLDGFGYADTHETLNNFIWGIDGWLYGNHGVFNLSWVGPPGAPRSKRTKLAAGVWRYHPTRHLFEVYAHGGSNQWGLDYTSTGEWWMTHCRSRWGGGPITHVMQGGHYWNQVNNGYAPFICKTPLPDRPWMKNYLLASARYGHGEGGAGRPGSRAVYGGHAHVGTLIYDGHNWPANYRGRLLTHNLHGHQINQIRLEREGSSYQAIHAGRDIFFCSDPTYVAVDLKVGPDGAVYMTDWSDRRHCHNPNAELWDRTNGRIYRLQFARTYRPVSVDYEHASDEELVAALQQQSGWHRETVVRVLAERAARGRKIAVPAVTRLRQMLRDSRPDIRVAGLWGLFASKTLTPNDLRDALEDPREEVRGWGVTLAPEVLSAEALAETLRRRVQQESSPSIQRRWISLIGNLPTPLAWEVAEVFAQSLDGSDEVLVKLFWHNLAVHLSDESWERALAMAETTPAEPLRDYIHWYGLKNDSRVRHRLLERAVGEETDESAQLRWLELAALALDGMRGVPGPDVWYEQSGKLYGHSNPRLRQAARRVGAALADPRLYQIMRSVLASDEATTAERAEAIAVLAADDSQENVPLLLRQLDRPKLVRRVLPLLGKYDTPKVAHALLDRWNDWPDPLRDAALEVLCSRATWSILLLDRIERGDFSKEHLTAYYVRKMSLLGDAELNERLKKGWGLLRARTDKQKEQAIDRLVAKFQEAPLWAYSAAEGKKLYTKLCAACHESANGTPAVAPAISGIRQKGIRYVVENVIDPNAVIGKDFLAVIYRLEDGRVVSGLPVRETDSTIAVQTANGTETIRRSAIEAHKVSENSLMPEGLLDALTDRQRLELLKYLATR